MFDRVRTNWLVIGCLAVLVLTVIAGVFQYRWINYASDSHRRQGRDAMEVALRNFSGDFRGTLLQLPPFFRPSPVGRDALDFEVYLLDVARRWRTNSDRPQLLASVSLGTQGDKGVSFRRLKLRDNRFNAEEWPKEFGAYRRVIEERLRLPDGQLPFVPNGFAFEFFQGRPTLIFPLVTGEAGTGNGQRSNGVTQQPLDPRNWLHSLKPTAPDASDSAVELRGWCFLEVDSDYLRQKLIPELVVRHYGSGNRYQVAVLESAPVKLLYGSDPALTIGSYQEVDAGVVLLDGNMQGRQAPAPLVSGSQAVTINEIRRNRGDVDDLAWVLVVRNRAGSIEALVDNARLHILVFSLIMLSLLAGSSVMLMLATLRARRLAQQQMEFVAGVSHELRTPLTVIQSTSYNLSRGTIQDPNRVQQYGDVIQREARRLINQVERMLSFAGIQSGRRVFDLQPTSVNVITERSLAQYAAPFSEADWQIEQKLAEDLPLVLTDGPALESALKNLFENAIKYAGQGKWLSVTTSVGQGAKGREVQITVADRGPGIAPKDLPHIFEPFYRGQNAIGGTANGTGLGLSLVERNLRALGGRVTVKSTTVGTSFTLHLPI